jgi:hypothetical protein
VIVLVDEEVLCWERCGWWMVDADVIYKKREAVTVGGTEESTVKE